VEYQHAQPVVVSPHASRYYTFERFIADMYSRDVILELRSVRWELSAQVSSAVERAGCGRTCRGRRAGKHVIARRHCIAHSETSDGEIPVLSTTCRRRSNSSSGRVGDRDRRDVVLRPTLLRPTKPSVENSRSPVLQSTTDHRFTSSTLQPSPNRTQSNNCQPTSIATTSKRGHRPTT